MKWLASGIPHGQGESKSDALLATQAAIDAEIKLIERQMGTKAYIENESLQARLRSLYAARER
jgi:hypothetical protein